VVDEDLGFDGTLAEILAIWEADAGRYAAAGSPWRPSAGDAAVYRRLAEPKLGGRTLVLGSTPELRDLVAEAGGQTVVLELSTAMHACTSGMLRCADPSREAWIQADWCEALAPTHEFDLVLGDDFWWGESVPRQHLLRDALHGALVPGGLLVTRARITDVTRAADDPLDVFGSYLELLSRAPDEEQLIRGAMYSWLYDHTADHERQRLDRERARALVLSLAEIPQLCPYAEYLRGFAARLPGPNWTSQSRDELLDVVRPSFRVVAEGHADDYESSLYPVLALEPV
jgi:hypothetical protein